MWLFWFEVKKDNKEGKAKNLHRTLFQSFINTKKQIT